MGDDQCISLRTSASDIMTSGTSPYLDEMLSAEGGEWAVLTVVKGIQPQEKMRDLAFSNQY